MKVFKWFESDGLAVLNEPDRFDALQRHLNYFGSLVHFYACFTVSDFHNHEFCNEKNRISSSFVSCIF